MGNNNLSEGNFIVSRIKWLDTLKGFGIILVVFGHIYKNDFVYNWVYAFHMPLFFFAAGYVYKEKPVLIDIKRRIQTILIPYFIFGTIGLVYWIAFERHFRDSNMTILQSVLGLFRGQYTWLDFNVHLWFLPCFFVTVILFNVLVRKISIQCAYAFSMVLSIVYVSFSLPELPWGIDRVCRYIGFYAIGVFTRSFISPSFDIISVRQNKIVMFVIGVVLLLFVAYLAQISKRETVMWFVNGLIGIAGCVILARLCDCRLFQYLGQGSIITLCFHGPVYRVLVKAESVLLNIKTEYIRESFILAILTILFTLFICSVMYKMVLLWFPWTLGMGKNECKCVKGNIDQV